VKAQFAALLGAVLLAACAATPAPRSQAAVNAFKREAPCPATGASRGPCPGYVVDHVVPLCAGGPDKPANMQWQTVAEGKLKDRDEMNQCRPRATAASS
jgi:hypothetical protein